MTPSSDPGSTGEVTREGRLPGLDYGTKRLGIAISDMDQTLAGSLETHIRCGPQGDARRLQQIVKENLVVGIVVGLPVHMSGDEGGKAKEARAFGEWVAEVTQLPLQYCDERFTTATAEARLMQADLSKKKFKQKLDKVAAQVLLQSFLDAKDRTLPPQPL
ncbi:MAG: Holliday junction resolvase RuvX [Planctomycetaceae bacterium]